MHEKLNVSIHLNLYNCYILSKPCVKGVLGVPQGTLVMLSDTTMTKLIHKWRHYIQLQPLDLIIRVLSITTSHTINV